MRRSDTPSGGSDRGARPPRLRHGFRPGRLISGLTVVGTAAAYLADAAGAWRVPSYLALPVVFAGLLLAGTASWIAYGVRRRAARAASTDRYAAPASTSGSQAMR
ncbi:hypothetical protein [Streptomyces sp. NPDC054887]